jgi:hypothetical protein
MRGSIEEDRELTVAKTALPIGAMSARRGEREEARREKKTRLPRTQERVIGRLGVLNE